MLEYRDSAGNVIPYGERWPDSPPDDAYSVVSNPERYAPLHAVALALEAWLTENFVAAPSQATAPVEPLQKPDWALSQLTLTPADPGQASLTITLTSFPGVHVKAGVHFATAFPSCGCDACDEDVQGQIEELEEVVFAVVRGQFAEVVSGTSVGYSIEGPAWSRSGTTPNAHPDPSLPLPPSAWGSWTARPSSG